MAQQADEAKALGTNGPEPNALNAGCGDVEQREKFPSASARPPPGGRTWDMKIRFYGRLADSFGSDIDFPIEGSCSVDDLRVHLATEHPDAANLLGPRVRACVADVMVAGDHIVLPSDSIEFLPPVSGG